MLICVECVLTALAGSSVELHGEWERMRKHMIHPVRSAIGLSSLVVPVSGSRVSPAAGGSHAETLQPHTSATSPHIMTSEMTDFDEVSPDHGLPAI